MTSQELKDFLNRHGLVSKQFAAILGVTHMAVNHWLEGKRDVSKPVSRLCKLFDKYPQLMKEFAA